MTSLVSNKPTRIQDKGLVSAVTLISLGLSVFILDSWPNLFVRLFVGLFWSSFLLILNGPALVQLVRNLNPANAEQRAVAERPAAYRQRISSY